MNIYLGWKKKSGFSPLIIIPDILPSVVTTAFKDAYKRLNPAQKEAVDTIEGPVMVVAGPGTGKTQILTVRIANILLQTQVNPENILALTFTESAAAQMRKRLVDLIGTPGYKVEICTFHGFCNDVIKSNPEEFPTLMMSDSITEVEQIQILEDLILESDLKFLRPFGEPLYHLRNILSAISDLKKEGIDPDEFKEAKDKQKENFKDIEDLYHDKGKYKGQMKGKYIDLQKSITKNEELLYLYRKYQEKLSEVKGYDFNDMLLMVKEALTCDKDLLLRLQEKYQYILVDEHQDTNSAQNKIIELMSGFFEEPNLFVVGDEKQAIFRFQGASLENFLYFKTLFPSAKLINLDFNYRSHQVVLDAADSVIQKNITAGMLSDQRIRLLAQAGIDPEPIKLAVLNDYHSEYEFIAQDIKRKNDEGTPLSDLAVLARKNRDLVEAAAALQRNGIQYVISSDISVLNDLDIKKFLLILRSIHNLGSDIELVKAMHVDFLKIEPLDIYKLSKKAADLQRSIYDLVGQLKEENELHLENPKRVIAFIENLKRWSVISHNNGFEAVFVDVFKTSGFREYVLSSPRKYEIIDKLTALFEITKEKAYRKGEYTLDEFIQYLNLLEKHGVGIETKIQTKYKDAVNLMTAHKSKGLEFDSVYIVNTVDGVWGNNRARGSGFVIPWNILGVKLVETDGNEDERRLFYVALTRAKCHIMISFSTRSLDGKEQMPSQFIEEIDPGFLKELDITDFEKGFLDNKEMIFNSRAEEEVPEKNQKFVQELFRQQGMNVSAFNNYLECPWKYFFVSLLRLPEVQNKHLVFGTAMHRVIDHYIKNKNTKKLETIFKETVMRSLIPPREKQETLEKGAIVIPALVRGVLQKLPENIQSEMTIKGVKLSEDVFLSGRLDMIELLGTGDRVRVHDFKTGSPKSRNQIMGATASSDGNYYRQLIFYKILLDKYHHGKMRMVEGVIDFVEPDDKGRFKAEGFEITEDEVPALENQILFVSDEIKSLSFWNRTCGDNECEYCKLREIMKVSS